ncbi:MAG: NIPSNAP family protein [Burkholderiales bacterium]|jgi:hypothetical protein|nr:NIPSNAP family protein [Burkholderiales bacterium]MBP7522843.1 NIPSNAP family protein [Leptothrix sp. (in: b-proteobacteria)]HQY09428.1 NIPSNAP family protein [Burkholderiaceae bacterium]
MPLDLDPAAGSRPIHPLAMNSKALVDHRIYTIALRRMPEFLEVFDRLAMPILLRTLGAPLGFWVSQVGPQNQFVHLWGYDSLADYERRCQARDTHPDFPAYLAASGHLITAQETRLIRRVELPSVAPAQETSR